MDFPPNISVRIADWFRPNPARASNEVIQLPDYISLSSEEEYPLPVVRNRPPPRSFREQETIVLSSEDERRPPPILESLNQEMGAIISPENIPSPETDHYYEPPPDPVARRRARTKRVRLPRAPPTRTQPPRRAPPPMPPQNLERIDEIIYNRVKANVRWAYEWAEDAATNNFPTVQQIEQVLDGKYSEYEQMKSDLLPGYVCEEKIESFINMGIDDKIKFIDGKIRSLENRKQPNEPFGLEFYLSLMAIAENDPAIVEDVYRNF